MVDQEVLRDAEHEGQSSSSQDETGGGCNCDEGGGTKHQCRGANVDTWCVCVCVCFGVSNEHESKFCVNIYIQ